MNYLYTNQNKYRVIGNWTWFSVQRKRRGIRYWISKWEVLLITQSYYEACKALSESIDMDLGERKIS